MSICSDIYVLQVPKPDEHNLGKVKEWNTVYALVADACNSIYGLIVDAN